MTDVFSKDDRSAIMKKVHSSGNESTEMRLIHIFKRNGIVGWRRGYKAKGHPDFVFLKQRIAVFVDGCFWHGHNCRNVRPLDNAEYWSLKIVKTKQRDEESTLRFIERGWIVIRIWECEFKKKNESVLMKKLEPIFSSCSISDQV